jgi:hypothetical protein
VNPPFVCADELNLLTTLTHPFRKSLSKGLGVPELLAVVYHQDFSQQRLSNPLIRKTVIQLKYIIQAAQIVTT